MKKNFISIYDYSAAEIMALLDLAKDLKFKQKNGEPHQLLKGKTLAMLFEKPSCRTRASFDVGMWQLGGYAINLSPEEIQLGKRETIADVARTLSRYVDGIMLRTYSHKTMLEMGEHATVPVINGLSDLLHPCQALADVFTILEKKKALKGIHLAYIGDGNNVCHSLMFAAVKLGLHLIIATPAGFEPKEEIVKKAFQSKGNGEIEIYDDPVAAVCQADVIYTDVWTSMGQEKEKEKRRKIFKDYQINSKLVKLAKKDVMVMHCLPAYRGEEITDEVMDGPHSVVFDQAENRLHVQKAILVKLLGSS